MKSKKFIFLSVFLLTISFCLTSLAETIYFRDGRILKEEIVEKGSYYIITKEKGVLNKYYMGQVERIEEEGIEGEIDMGNIDVSQFEAIGLSVDKAKLVVVLIDVSGVRDSMTKSLDKVLEGVPDEEKDVYKKVFNINEIIERLVPLYDKYYTEEELLEIIKFYESPAGKKALEATPQIMQESVGVSLKYFEDKMAEQYPNGLE